MVRTSNFCWLGVFKPNQLRNLEDCNNTTFLVEGQKIRNTPHGRRSHYISLYSRWFFEGSLDGWYFLGGHFQTCHGVKNRKCWSKITFKFGRSWNPTVGVRWCLTIFWGWIFVVGFFQRTCQGEWCTQKEPCLVDIACRIQTWLFFVQRSVQ